MFTIELGMPPTGDNTLIEWMFDPAMERNGQVLLRDLTGSTLKVIKFYNAYCVELEPPFDATGHAQHRGSFTLHLRISPQAVNVGGHFHARNVGPQRLARCQLHRGLGLD